VSLILSVAYARSLCLYIIFVGDGGGHYSYVVCMEKLGSRQCGDSMVVVGCVGSSMLEIVDEADIEIPSRNYL
jgi:hypothetical protein